MLKRVNLFAIVLTGLFLLAGAGTVRADDWCFKHVQHQQHELDEAIHDHGYFSRQADRERRKLDQVRDECRYRQDRDRYRDRDRDYDHNYYR